MESMTTTTRCAKCEELQRLYLAALKDKRTILVRLQNELEEGRKAREELDAMRGRERQATGQKRLDENASVGQSRCYATKMA